MKCLMFCLAALLAMVLPAAAQPLPELIPYKTATGWAYSDSNKVIKVLCIYQSASLFYNGQGRVTMERRGNRALCCRPKWQLHHRAGAALDRANASLLKVRNAECA